jgi:hypothetical protein
VARPCLEFPGRSTNLAPSKVIKELGSKRGPKGGCLGLVYMGLVCCDVVTFEKKHETGGLTHHVGDCRLTERICNWNDRRSLRFGSEKLHQWQWRYMRYTWDIHEIYMRCSVGGQLLGDLCQQSFVIRITRLLCNGQPVNQSLAILPSRFLQTCLIWKASVIFYPLVN